MMVIGTAFKNDGGGGIGRIDGHDDDDGWG